MLKMIADVKVIKAYKLFNKQIDQLRAHDNSGINDYKLPNNQKMEFIRLLRNVPENECQQKNP